MGVFMAGRPKKIKSILEATRQLEDIINAHMERFVALGKQAKEASIKDLPRREIEMIWRKMYDVLVELKTVDEIVREQNAHLVPLMDALIKYYAPKDMEDLMSACNATDIDTDEISY